MESQHDRRSYIRFDSEEFEPILLSREKTSPPFYALMIDESYKGYSCVYVGSFKFEVGDFIYWQETSQISTLCKVTRCDSVQNRTYNLAFVIHSENQESF